ncbi:hypothetical protein ANANG_G00167910, partial [Anguilla anguilla]
GSVCGAGVRYCVRYCVWCRCAVLCAVLCAVPVCSTAGANVRYCVRCRCAVLCAVPVCGTVCGAGVRYCVRCRCVRCRSCASRMGKLADALTRRSLWIRTPRGGRTGVSHASEKNKKRDGTPVTGDGNKTRRFLFLFQSTRGGAGGVQNSQK